MLKSNVQSLFADPDGAPALIRRLLTEQASRPVEALRGGVRADGGRRRRTALGAYLIGDVINAAYVDKNLPRHHRRSAWSRR